MLCFLCVQRDSETEDHVHVGDRKSVVMEKRDNWSDIQLTLSVVSVFCSLAFSPSAVTKHYQQKDGGGFVCVVC